MELLEANNAVEAKDTEFGKMVVGINSVKPTDQEFWAFYVEDKQATVGAQLYNCLDNENIEWKLEKIQ